VAVGLHEDEVPSNQDNISEWVMRMDSQKRQELGRQKSRKAVEKRTKTGCGGEKKRKKREPRINRWKMDAASKRALG
jgi:hypothetical protein